jgi:hypothetical protein
MTQKSHRYFLITSDVGRLTCAIVAASAIVIAWAGPCFAEPVPGYDFRKPQSESELRYWLENMVWNYSFTADEIAAATGLDVPQIEAALARFKISPGTEPARAKDAPLLMTPWPGGRAVSNMGKLDAKQKKLWGERVEETRQRETKAGVFAPWADGGYVVLDAPEAIRSNLGLLYLAHVAVETVWTKQNVELEKLEWDRRPDGSLNLTRTLPNGVSFTSRFVPSHDAIRMKISLMNGSDTALSGLWVQNCVFLKGLRGFEDPSPVKTVSSSPYTAQGTADGRRWVITAWVPCEKIWANPLNPCFHSDPAFADCPPGQTRHVYGWLSFYEGDDIRGEFSRIEQTGWQTDRWEITPGEG